MDKKVLIVVGILSLIVLISLISAAPKIPQLTSHSPQDAVYDSTKVSFNVTSNEVVDFFIKDFVGNKDTILMSNTKELNGFLYSNVGRHSFTIWANNSKGETSETIFYSTTEHNPVNITSCGILTSSDTKYILQNDISISDGTRYCLKIDNVRNVTVDLNGYSVENTFTSGYSRVVQTWYSFDIEIFNGTIKSPPAGFPYLIEPYGTQYFFHDLKLNGGVGMNTLSMRDVILENITMNTSIGFWHYFVSDVHIINSSIEWNGANVGVTSGIYDQSDSSEIFLENTTLTGFPVYDIYLDSVYSDIYLRSSHPNLSKVRYPTFLSDSRFFTQHLVVVNLTDENGNPVAGVAEIADEKVLRSVKTITALSSVSVVDCLRDGSPVSCIGLIDIGDVSTSNVANMAANGCLLSSSLDECGFLTTGTGGDSWTEFRFEGFIDPSGVRITDPSSVSVTFEYATESGRSFSNLQVYCYDGRDYLLVANNLSNSRNDVNVTLNLPGGCFSGSRASDVRVRFGQYSPFAATGKIFFDFVKAQAGKNIYDVESQPITSVPDNPTRQVFVATNEKGIGSVWLTEKTTIGRTSSPVNVTEINFPRYNLTARSKDVTLAREINFSTNSTIPVDFRVDFSGVKLRPCTVDQMFDLNNDGVVDVVDRKFISDWIVGKSVNISSQTKNCEGINFY